MKYKLRERERGGKGARERERGEGEEMGDRGERATLHDGWMQSDSTFCIVYEIDRYINCIQRERDGRGERERGRDRENVGY